MELGLKRGVVKLADHDPEWKELAARTIKLLWRIFGSVATDIQHVGSTAVRGIKAKPIIDIAVAVEDFAKVETLIPALEQAGFTYRSDINDGWQRYIVYHDSKNDCRINDIHVVLSDSNEWQNYLLFRDYLNNDSDMAQEYEKVKLEMMARFKRDRVAYCDGKTEFCSKALDIAQIWASFGKRFTKIEPITKGWSEDKKYCVIVAEGTKYLLRISPAESYETKKVQFIKLKSVFDSGMPMCNPVEFGTCADGVYTLYSWIEGEAAENLLPDFPKSVQYALGVKAGEILLKIHSLTSIASGEWNLRFFSVMDKRISAYKNGGVRFDGDDKVLAYIDANRHLLSNRPQTFRHGDFSVGNIFITTSHDVNIIDWELDSFDNMGDPWLDFTDVIWSADISPHFASGVINGYFKNAVLSDFWECVMYYVFASIISFIQLTSEIRRSVVENEVGFCKKALTWFDNMRSPVPTWYLKGELL